MSAVSLDKTFTAIDLIAEGGLTPDEQRNAQENTLREHWEVKARLVDKPMTPPTERKSESDWKVYAIFPTKPECQSYISNVLPRLLLDVAYEAQIDMSI